jgi:hypothetical protein
LKCLGRWYANPDGTPAKIIPERAGGWGEALIDNLRSENDGLKPYGNIYQHERTANLSRPRSHDLGFPMHQGTRGIVIERLRQWVRERRFPFLPPGHVDELGTFIYREKGTSPRAMDGCNDDRVISLALAVHLFETIGEVPLKDESRKRRWRKKPYQPPPTRS